MKTKIGFNGKTIEVSSRHIGYDYPAWADGYKKHHFKIKMGDPRSVLETLCSDASYGDRTIDEFNS